MIYPHNVTGSERSFNVSSLLNFYKSLDVNSKGRDLAHTLSSQDTR